MKMQSGIDGGAQMITAPWIGFVDRVVLRASVMLSALGSAAIASFMLVIFVDVAMRRGFNMPLFGVGEFVAYSIVAAVFFQLGATIRHGKMISADFLMSRWERNPVLAEGLKALYSLIACILLFRILAWLADDALTALERNEFAGAIGAFQLPLWPFKMATAVGALVALAECILVLFGHAHRCVRALRSSEDARSGLVGLVVAVALLGLAALLLMYGGLNRVQIGLLAFVCLFALVAGGMPVAFALILTSFVAIWAIRNNIDIADSAMGMASAGAVRSFEFGVVPLFVIMGLVLDRADVGRDAFRVAVVLLRRVRGGLANATVAANALFAAIVGSSIASAAVFSRIAVPPMVEAGYSRRFAVGVVAGSSILGMLIPPSLLLIVYGLVAEASVGALFIAAIVPGLLLAFCFGLMNVFVLTFAKGFAGEPKSEVDVERMPVSEMARNLAPICLLIALVMGGIYGGVFSPTEAGAMGALGAIAIAVAKGRLDWRAIRSVVLEAGYITSGILFLIIAASLYSRMLAVSSIPMQMTQFISGYQLTLIAFCLVYLLLIIGLGMILDAVSILLIVVPIALPIVVALGGDPIWFGILTVIAVEIGLLTPPFGLSVFVVKGSLPDRFVSLGDIFVGVAPYTVTMILFTILLILVPGIALVFR